MKAPEMTAEGVVEIIKLLEENGIEVYVDGGWGVDALLGDQTRKHEDLDIALPHRFVPKLRNLFEARSYKEVYRPDSWECNFVLGDEQGYLIDVHSYTFDENGKNIFGVAYKPHHLTGTGTINGYPVKCPPPDVMVEFHTGYDVDENDYHDIKALCKRFDIPLPKDYEKFEKKYSIRIITENKKGFLPLLLLGDEQESQIDKYLERGDMFALYENGFTTAVDIKSVCIVTDEGNGTLEIQNLATDQHYQRQGYASSLIDYIVRHYTGRYDKIILGTGDVPGILSFYERRGFSIAHRIQDYFTIHYNHPIIEDGILLKDKVYLERKLKEDM